MSAHGGTSDLWQTVNSIVVVIYIPGMTLYVTGNHVME